MGHFAGELSVLYSARNVADESVYWHYVDYGVVTEKKGTRDGCIIY